MKDEEKRKRERDDERVREYNERKKSIVAGELVLQTNNPAKI